MSNLPVTSLTLQLAGSMQEVQAQARQAVSALVGLLAPQAPGLVEPIRDVSEQWAAYSKFLRSAVDALGTQPNTQALDAAEACAVADRQSAARMTVPLLKIALRVEIERL